ncbi:MAG: hypothetical protein KAT37_00510 [Candidatus Aenigmarchaeota archaeon]|nr:hypothetical protein [Candidatus Aenigmarchaeota archaeon]
MTDNYKEIERRKKFIKEHVGNESLNVLKEQGIDIDNTLDSIIKGQVEREKELEKQREKPSVENVMTSELVYLSQGETSFYRDEYFRRLNLIGLSEPEIVELDKKELSVILSGAEVPNRNQPWVGRYFFMQGTTPEQLPKPEDLTLSELIMITDDANSAFWRDHEWLSKETWQAVCIAASCAQYTEAKYAHAFGKRVKELGCSQEQEGAYTKNECYLAERLKWGRKDIPVPWTKESTDLKKYKR